MTFVGALRIDGRRSASTRSPNPVAPVLRGEQLRGSLDDSPSTDPRYRADIDGLRAIALLAVLLVHSGLAGVSGGFIGVDIFFVISGYLIHQDLSKRLAEGRFSIREFYQRRLRRTVPALYLVAGVTLAAAAVVMVPGDLDEAAQSVLSTIGLAPNLYFWHRTGYFGSEAITKPLLHTWSLGVEAQFYLVAPLFALALCRLRRGLRHAALAAILGLAIAGAVLLHRAGWGAGFYLTPARLFEFLIGIALAEGLAPPVTRALTAEIVAALALLTIGLCIAFFEPSVPHPGLPTLVPCLAAAAIIHVGGMRRTLVGRLLGLPPIVFVGVISYSLYLWHWPVLVLTHAVGIEETPLILGTQAVLVFALSILSWRFVEVPFRTRGSPCYQRAPWLAPAGAAVLAASAFVILQFEGLPQRFPPDVAAVASYYDRTYDASFRQGRCFITSKDSAADFDHETCLRFEPKTPNVLLLGDSHAAQLYTALRETWPGLNVLQATASGCKPELGTSGSGHCTALMSEMLTRFVPAHRFDAIVIAGLWEADDLPPLKRTIAALAPSTTRVVVFGPLPRYDMPLATLLARGMLRRSFDDVPNHLYDWVAPLDDRMRAELAPLATYVSPWQVLCGSGRCRLFAEPGVPLQFDFHHLTPAGARVLMAAVAARHPALFGTTPGGARTRMSASITR